MLRETVQVNHVCLGGAAVFLLCCSCIPSSRDADLAFQLNGVVVGPSGEGIENAKVELVHERLDTIVSVKSGSAGVFSFDDLPSGGYAIGAARFDLPISRSVTLGTLASSSPPELNPLVLEIMKGVMIEGILLAEDGSTLRGVRVEAVRQDEMFHEAAMITNQPLFTEMFQPENSIDYTDESGKFRNGPVHPNVIYRVTAHLESKEYGLIGKGSLLEKVEIRVGEDSELFAGLVVGLVREAGTGELLVGASVCMSPVSRSEPSLNAAISGALFRVYSPPHNRPWRLTIDCPGYQRQTIGPFAAIRSVAFKSVLLSQNE